MGLLLPIAILRRYFAGCQFEICNVLFARALFAFCSSGLVSAYLKTELPLRNVLGVLSQMACVMKWS